MFIQADWLDPTEPGVGTNRYGYSHNNSINQIDKMETPHALKPMKKQIVRMIAK